MKTFQCGACQSLVFFDNVKCMTCGHLLGFLPGPMELTALEPAGNETWRALGLGQEKLLYRPCQNGRQHQVCNWMVPVQEENSFCVSCRLNELIPNLSTPGNLERWHKLEMAKRRIVYTILRLGLPLDSLRFDFVGEAGGGATPMTGHLEGLITINIAEADEVERERRRVHLHEPYRTLLGHLRHEIAHFYWDRLMAHSPRLPEFRRWFGDETADYAAALKQYYETGPAPDWQTRSVSAYATSHPWEDWAETWAHYFHIVDMVETAASFGLTLNPKHPAANLMTAHPQSVFDVNMNFNTILENWFPLTYALNSLNRGMGLPDVYPFAISNKAIGKLQFVHEVIQASRGKTEQAAPTPGASIREPAPVLLA